MKIVILIELGAGADPQSYIHSVFLLQSVIVGIFAGTKFGGLIITKGFRWPGITLTGSEF